MSRPINNLRGKRFGRLLVIQDSGKRTTKGEVVWQCVCDCGTVHHVNGGNLHSKSVSSCGCFAREQSSMRRKASAGQPKQCSIAGCGKNIEKGGHGLCGMHSQRLRRYGNPNYVVPEDLRRIHNRNAQVSRFAEVKADTYRKRFGRHEHRVVAEEMLGRRLRSDEHVHHKDGNKQNNDSENLEVMSWIDHLRLHRGKRGAPC